MTDKFTIRDFFAYFLSGCALYLALLVSEFDKIYTFFIANKDFIKDNSAIIIFGVLPIVYFTGQTIQSIDTLFYEMGVVIWRLNEKYKNKFLKGLYYILCSHRISGNLNLRNIPTKEFCTKCNELELVSKYGHAEYWYIMNDLFKGVTLINLTFAAYSLFICKFDLGLIFLFLTFIFWVRARYYATIFIDTIISTRDALETIKPETKK